MHLYIHFGYMCCFKIFLVFVNFLLDNITTYYIIYNMVT